MTCLSAFKDKGIQHHFQYVNGSFHLVQNRNIGIFSVPNKKNRYLNDTPFFMAQVMKFQLNSKTISNS